VLQQSLRNHLKEQQINKQVVTVVAQVKVDKND